jgi:hypothetical protein
VTAQKPGYLSYLLPSIGNIIFVSLLFVLVTASETRLLHDGDTGYHIRTGEIILKTWQVPTEDPFSNQRPPLKWTTHEWLAEVLMAALFKTAGLTSVVVFFAFLLTITHWSLYFLLRSKSENIILVTTVTLLATASSSIHWLARPHVFSLSLTLIWYFLLDEFQYREKKTLIYLPFLMLLWVNLHAGYFFALVLLSIYLAGNVVQAIVGFPEQVDHHRQKARMLLCTLFFSILACLINPIGYEILRFPAQLTSNRFIMDRVSEFMSPNFHEVLPFKYMLLAMIGVLALSRKSLNLIETALLLLLSYMALYSARYISLYAIIAAPILLKVSENTLSEMPGSVSDFFRVRNSNLLIMEEQIKGKFWPLAGTLIVISLVLTGTIRFRFNEKIFPVAAVESLKREHINGKMFNDDEFGDYMIFAAWPTYQVFMDGRSDMYGEKFGAPYLKVANVQPGWKEILDKFKIEFVVFGTDSALTAALRMQPEWHPVYTDTVATIFVKKNSLNDRLLAKNPQTIKTIE